MRRIRYSFITFLLLLVSYSILDLACPQVYSATTSTESTNKISEKQKVAVLMYHEIAPHVSKKDRGGVSVEQFREHLRALQDNGYSIITMSEFQKFMEERAPVPEHSVVITFDDGYQSFYTYAYPALQDAGATASVFVIGAYTDMYNSDALPHLTWDQMRELKDSGMGVYNHSYNSHHYAKASESGKEKPELAGPLYLANHKRMETKSEFRKRVRSDLAFMEKRLSEELGEAPGIMAIPFGIYDKAVLEEGKEAGISLFFTTKEGMNTPSNAEIFRINAGKPNFSGKQLIERIKKLES